MILRFTCPNCGESLESPADMAGQSTPCPKCNKEFVIPHTSQPGSVHVVGAVEGSPRSTNTPQISGLAITSMVLGVVGFLGSWACCVGFVLSLLAIIFGHIAYAKVSRDPKASAGKALAITGFTLGYVGLLFGIAMTLLLGTMTAAMGAVTAAMGSVLGQVTNQLQQVGGYHH